MKVWINYREGSYSGGILLVAANTAEEAHRTFHDDPNLGYMWDTTYDGYIDDYYYRADGWKEMPNMTSNVDKPQVLAEGGYTE